MESVDLTIIGKGNGFCLFRTKPLFKPMLIYYQLKLEEHNPAKFLTHCGLEMPYGSTELGQHCCNCISPRPKSVDSLYQWVSARKNVTPLLLHWSYVFLALTHRYQHYCNYEIFYCHHNGKSVKFNPFIFTGTVPSV